MTTNTRKPMSELIPSQAPLTQLADQINAKHVEAETALRAGLERAREAGLLLIAAKAQLAHGAWLPWLKANVRFSKRTAQAYVRIAREWDRLAAKSATVALLGYREALETLAEPSEDRQADHEPETSAEGVYFNGTFYPTPYANLLPDLEGEDWENFLESVRLNGVLVAVRVDENGNVIDGRQRLRAAEAIGLKEVPIQVDAGLDDDEQLRLWTSLNVHRAHYGRDQRMAIAVEAAELSKRYD
jgi:hypothetical protein